MELGIAGVPDDVHAVERLCEQLALEPVYLLGPRQTVSLEGKPLHMMHVPAWEAEEIRSRVRGTGLRGLWAGSRELAMVAAEVAGYFNLPHLDCPEDAALAASFIEGAHLMEVGDIEGLSNAQLEAIPVPFWVRPACGFGDSSCMRIENASDLALTAGKLKKRGITGTIRLQPVVEGPVYRLMAFKIGREFIPFDIISEESTTSMFRVPLSWTMPVPRRGVLHGKIVELGRRVGRALPAGWGYIEMEFVDSDLGLRLVDIQCPSAVDPLLREVVLRSQGVDLLRAALQCAVGRVPQLSPTRELGAASTWLLTRSGTVTGFKGVDEARAMPGVAEVRLTCRVGDELTHVVDLRSRGHGGYVVATGATAAIARERMEAARDQVWINTTPVKS